jgi:electron transfer flavoprotein alpha subunit
MGHDALRGARVETRDGLRRLLHDPGAARGLGEASGRDVVGIVVAADPSAATTELARYVPRVIAVTEAATADHAAASIVGQRIAALIERDQPAYLFAGAGPEGRDVAGVVSVLTGRGVLVNATAVRWDNGPVVEMSVFGGKLNTTSRFTADAGIVTVRPNVVTAEPAATPGAVEPGQVVGELDLPQVPVVERIAAATAAAPIEEARVIVAGGRGVGGPEGFKIVEELARMASVERNHALAEVRTAVDLTDEQRRRLAEALSRATGRTVDLKVVVDPSVIGGVVARVGDEVFDGSIASRLEDAKQALGSV